MEQQYRVPEDNVMRVSDDFPDSLSMPTQAAIIKHLIDSQVAAFPQVHKKAGVNWHAGKIGFDQRQMIARHVVSLFFGPHNGIESMQRATNEWLHGNADGQPSRKAAMLNCAIEQVMSFRGIGESFGAFPISPNELDLYAVIASSVLFKSNLVSTAICSCFDTPELRNFHEEQQNQ